MSWRLLIALVVSLPSSGFAQPASLWPELNRVSPGVADGQKDSALIVGIETYLAAPGIPGAKRNAHAWYDYFRQVKGIPSSSIGLLLDSGAAKEDIEKAAAKAATTVGRGGTLWFVFIGHGAPAADQRDGVLLGVDAQQTVSSIASRSIRQQDLFRRLAKGKQARTVAVLDSCFSGRSTAGKPLAPGAMPMLAAKTRRAPRKTLVFTAAMGDQFAGALPRGARPAFSYLMLGALRGWADSDRNGRVTANEAFGYVKEVLGTLVAGRTQTPDFLGVSSVLAAGVAEIGPSLDDIRLGRKATTSRPIQCPRGSRWDGGACVGNVKPAVKCPPGFTFRVGSGCVESVKPTNPYKKVNVYEKQ